MSGQAFKEAFFAKCPQARALYDLFEYLPSTYFYSKDAKHRYVGVNRLVLSNVFGLEHEEQLLGKTDLDFQPPILAEAYHAEDTRVMESKSILPNEVWLVPHVRGTPKWYVSTKTPLLDPNDQVLGIAGVMYPIETPSDQSAYFRELAPVIHHIEENYDEQISMSEMASKAGLGSTQFNQRFRELLRISPSDYLLKLRIEAAQRLLTTTDHSLGQISSAVGFYDQSHFAKRFRRVTGMSPSAYRKRFR